MELHVNPVLINAEEYPVELAIYSKVKGEGMFQGSKAKDLEDLEFQQVDYIKKALHDLNDKQIEEIIKLVYNQKIEYKQTKALQFYRAFNYVVESIKAIYEKEKLLQSKASEKLEKAGVNKLAIFDSLNILDDIAVKYNTTPHDVETWAYSNVFVYAYKMRVEDNIQKELQEQTQ